MKKVFAFGLDLEVEDWVKFLAVDSAGEIWGYDKRPYVIDDLYWIVDGCDDLCKYYGQASIKENFRTAIIGI